MRIRICVVYMCFVMVCQFVLQRLCVFNYTCICKYTYIYYPNTCTDTVTCTCTYCCSNLLYAHAEFQLHCYIFWYFTTLMLWFTLLWLYSGCYALLACDIVRLVMLTLTRCTYNVYLRTSDCTGTCTSTCTLTFTYSTSCTYNVTVDYTVVCAYFCL